MADTFVKPPFYLSAKYLNDVNDSLQGGQLTSMPTGFSQYQQNIPGDRIILDDTTAYALSDTAIGTLYGGVYMYVNTLSTGGTPAVGTLAYFTGASVGSAAATGGPATAYQVTSTATPTTLIPTQVLGVFINVITAGNLGWIQVMGVAGVLFDSTVSAVTSGGTVIAKASAVVASTADNLTSGTAMTALITGSVLGISLATVTTSTVVKVAITRGLSRI
jgi:hypothetical protein